MIRKLTWTCAPLSLAACLNSEPPAGQSSAPVSATTVEKKSTTEPVAAKQVLVELPKLGLKVEVPVGTEVGDAVIGEGHILQGPELVASIEVVSDSRPKNLAEAQSDADVYAPINPSGETLPDGFAYTFEYSGGMGTNYWVMVRRNIGGKDYWCESTATFKYLQRNVLRACKSLLR